MEEKKTILLELNIDTVKSIRNQKELKSLLSENNKLLEDAEIGSDSYKKLEASSGLLTKRLKDLKDAARLSNAELNAQQGSLRDTQAQYNKLANALRETKKGNDVLGMSYDEAKKKAKALKEDIKDFEEELGNHQPNVGNYADSIKQAALDTGILGQKLGPLSGLFSTVKGGINGVSLSFKTLRGAIMATGLLALVAILGSLVVYFTQTSAGGKKLGQVLGAVGAVVGVLIDRIGKFAEAVLGFLTAAGKYLTGDFKGAAEAANKATDKLASSVDNLGGAIADAAEKGYDLAKAAQELVVAERALAKLSEIRKGQIGVLQKSAENQLLTEKERIANLQKAGKLIIENADDEIKLAKEKLRLAKENAALAGSGVTEDDLQNINDLEVALIRLANERDNLLTEIANKESGLIKAIADQRKKAEEDRLANLQKLRDAENALLLFRREAELNQLKELAKADSTSVEERIRLIELIRQKEIELQKERERILLSNDKLLENERILIKEQSAEEIRKIEKANADEILAIRKDLADKIKKAEQDLSLFRKQQLISETDFLLSDTKRSSNNRIDLLVQRKEQEIQLEKEKTDNLLANDKLTEAERILIEEQFAARKLEIERNTSAAILSIVDATEQQRIDKMRRAQDTIAGYFMQASDIAQITSDTRLNKELVAFEKQKKAELKLAGNNAAKKQEIEEKFAKKKADAERAAAIRANEIAKVQAIVNTFQSATKAATSVPFPLNIPLVVGATALGFAQVAKIDSESDKLDDGGVFGMIGNSFKQIKNFGKAAYGTIIGGKPHSMGGTKFIGDDGTRFEAERDEALVIVNKHDTPLLSFLSSINSIHGKPFFGDGGSYGSYLADGGFAARANSQPVVDTISNKNDILAIVSSLPSPLVLVEDINYGQNNRAKITSRANI